MLYVILGVIVLLAIGVVFIFNQLVGLRQMSENGWSDIEVQLKRRADLIPRLVSTVKGYASHEKKLFEDVTKMRAQTLAAGANPSARGAAEGAFGKAGGKLLAIAEEYPELKANQNFLDLQEELSDTEDKIEMARRFYNGTVRELNTKIQSVPSNLVAGLFGFRAKDYFEIDDADAAVPNVEFGT